MAKSINTNIFYGKYAVLDEEQNKKYFWFNLYSVPESSAIFS